MLHSVKSRSEEPPQAGGVAALAGAYVQAWNDRDIAAIMALHADDTTYRQDGGPDVRRGKAAVAAQFAAQLEAFQSLGFELTSLHAGDDHFVFEARITGSRRDGAPVALNGIDLVTVRDGLIVHKHSYAVPRRNSDARQ